NPISFLFNSYGEHFLPLNLLNHYLLFKLFGLNYIPFQISTLLFHVATVFVLYKIIVEETNNKHVDLFSTIIFGISAVYIEDVLWSQGISSVASALFVAL